MSNNSRQHYHDKGEQDAAEDKGYNPPNNPFFANEEEVQENVSYRQGWRNTKDQKD